jgi:hypothetical protein
LEASFLGPGFESLPPLRSPKDGEKREPQAYLQTLVMKTGFKNNAIVFKIVEDKKYNYGNFKHS